MSSKIFMKQVFPFERTFVIISLSKRYFRQAEQVYLDLKTQINLDLKRKKPFLGCLCAKSRLRRLRSDTLCGAVFRVGFFGGFIVSQTTERTAIRPKLRQEAV